MKLPMGGPIVIFTASFKELPTDKAGHIMSWLETDVKVAMLQRIPRLVSNVAVSFSLSASQRLG